MTKRIKGVRAVTNHHSGHFRIRVTARPIVWNFKNGWAQIKTDRRLTGELVPINTRVEKV